MRRTFPFVIVRATTAAPRNEVLNVGVVAWPHEASPQMLFDFSAQRLRALHPNLGRLDFTRWTATLGRALDEIKTTELQRMMLPMMAQPFTVDRAAGTMEAAEGDESHAIEQLFHRLVAGPTHRRWRP